MDKFSIDYGIVEKGLNKHRVFKLSDVADRIEKVAFDVVRFRDEDDTTKLWQIQDTPDGKVIVAIYKDEDGVIKSESEWQAIPDKHANVNIFRNGEPIVRLAASEFGIPADEIGLLCRWLPKKLAEDTEMQSYLLKKAQEEITEEDDDDEEDANDSDDMTDQE